MNGSSCVGVEAETLMSGDRMVREKDFDGILGMEDRHDEEVENENADEGRHRHDL